MWPFHDWLEQMVIFLKVRHFVASASTSHKHFHTRNNFNMYTILRLTFPVFSQFLYYYIVNSIVIKYYSIVELKLASMPLLICCRTFYFGFFCYLFQPQSSIMVSTVVHLHVSQISH